VKEIYYQPRALKSLRKMPRNIARRIIGRIEAFAADPASQKMNVKALKGTDAIRLRVGDWRVIMIDDRVIDVIAVRPRGGAYR
jgi:mRNA interferase RelE/StbE